MNSCKATLYGVRSPWQWVGAWRAVHGANDDSDEAGSRRCACGGGGGSGPHDGAANPPPANYDEPTTPPISFVEMLESRLTIDAAGNEVDDEAALEVLEDRFAEGGACFLKVFHDVDVAGLNYIEFSRLAVGMTLATAAAQLDFTPEMVLAAIPAGAPGVGGYSRSVLVQEPARLCRLGKERSAAAAHSAAPAAAAGRRGSDRGSTSGGGASPGPAGGGEERLVRRRVRRRAGTSWHQWLLLVRSIRPEEKVPIGEV